MRLLSHSEVGTALDCQVKHSFAYTGQLTGGVALKPKNTAPQLRAGRAWGGAVAAWHANPLDRMGHARVALLARLSIDSAQQQQFGFYDQDEHQALTHELLRILEDYAAHTEPLNLNRAEQELHVSIPSRGGLRASNHYRLLAYVDGVHTDQGGREWIVEFKLRGQLLSFEMIARQRQQRWYAWAWHRATGRDIAGVIVEERLRSVPSEPKFNKPGKDGTPLLSKVQACRPDTYMLAATGTGQEPDLEVYEKLKAKRWGQRHILQLTDTELYEAGQQLVSAASLIHQLDTGSLYPIRNPSPMRCPGCAFRDICTSPSDVDLIDALFERTEPKRSRGEMAHAA